MALGNKIDKCEHWDICETCIISKFTSDPYPKTAGFRATKAKELVHSDLCGPMETAKIGGKYYFLTFVDDFSRFTITYLLKIKEEIFPKFKEYVAMTANKFGKKLQAIHSDNEREYLGKEILKNEGIDH